MRRLLPLLASALIVGAVVLLLRPLTPHIDFNHGYGYDGVVYADMARAMRGESDGALLVQRPHYAYRPLPAALVAASPLDVSRGYLAMNLLAFVASGPVLYLLLRSYGAALAPALLAVFWWSLLPGGLRLAIYYPVQIDGIGLFFMLAALLAAAWRNVPLFGLALALAVLVRESLVVLLPVLWIRLLPLGVWRASALTALAAVPAAVLFEAVRIAPPLRPPNTFDLGFEMRQNWDWLLQNAADRAWRFAAAGPVALGLLFLLPLLRLPAAVRFCRAQPEWAYYLAATLAVIVVGGGDYDRYFMYFVPALALFVFANGAAFWSSAVRAGLLTLVQVALMRVWWPIGPSEVEYLGYNVATMPLAQLRDLAVLAAVGAVLAAAIIRWPSRARPSPRFAPAG